MGITRQTASYVPSSTTAVLPQWSSNASENLAILGGGARYYSAGWHSRRPVYTYSLLPGGAETPEQLQDAIAGDRQLASHYAGFQYNKARIVTLDRPQLVYLSYRKNGAIYWTRTRHVVPAGERIITDGNITARTRCANRISVQKQLAVAPDEPPAAALDEFALPPELVPFPAQFQSALSSPGSSPEPGPLSATPVALGGLAIFPPGLPIGSVCKPGKGERDCNKPPSGPPGPPVHPPPPPVPVPEPGSIILMCSGAAAIYARSRKLRRDKK